MGALAHAVSTLGGLFSERKTAIGAHIPTWEQGEPQYPRSWHNYYEYALHGYAGSEIVYACVEELATSAAEPRLVAVRKTPKGTEQLHDHPVLALLERPNPFLSRFQLIASLIMYRAVAGNAYLEIVRSAAGKVVELWPLRPDRMFVKPDQKTYIGGWQYRMGNLEPYELPPEDVIHSKTRHPLDDYYGLPPLAVCAQRVDTDAFMRSFTLAFFRNAAVPAGLLNITKQVTEAERQLIRDRFRGETGGPQSWHQMLVLDNTEASYTPMGLPLGSSGIVLPELDEISEARIAMALGVPLELIGARLGMVHGNRSTTLAARGTFWDETLVPLYQELAADLGRGLYPAYADTAEEFDYLEFDLSTVKALQEDDEAKHMRVRNDMAAGLISVQEARVLLGHEPDYEDGALLILNRGLEPMTPQSAEQGAPPYLVPATAAAAAQAPQPAPDGQQPAGAARNGAANGHGHGRTPLSKEDLAALAALASGADAPSP